MTDTATKPRGDLFSKFDDFIQARDTLLASGVTDPFSLVMEKVLSPTRAICNGRDTILLGTYNYMGMTFDPDVLDAGKQALADYGSGTTGSRVLNGTYQGHKECEDALREFYGMDHAMVFSTGYQANLGTLSGLTGSEDYLLVDSDSHASIYDGCRLSNAQTIRFRHNDPDNLDRRLGRLGNDARNAVIVVEGLYSMLGDQAPLEAFVEVKKRHGAWLLVDEAHSFGVFGERGLGLAEQREVLDEVDFIVGTFSKRLAGIGGFCVSPHPQLDGLRLASRPYIFTASPSPAVIAGTRAALNRVVQGGDLRRQLHRNIDRLYRYAKAAGYTLGSPTPGPVAALILPDRDTALASWRGLLQAGVYANLMIPPATPSGLNLLRISLSAAHSDADLDHIVEALNQVRAAA